MADNYKFVINGTDKTRAMFKSLKANLGGLRTAVNSTGAKIVGLAGAAGIGAMVKSSLAANDVLAKTADRLGLTTKELAAYQHQANLTGSSNEGMNKALEKMNRGLGEAERGTGTAKKALDDMGLSAEALNRMPTGQRFEAIAAAIGDVKDRSLQASYAADIFGRSGIQLINMIDAGAEGFAQAKKEVTDYGVAISRVDAAKLEAANDAMFRVGQIGQGAANQLTIHLAPIIEELAVQFSEAAKQGGGMGAMVRKAFDGGVKIAGVFANGIHGIKIIFQGVKTIAWGFGSAVVGATKLAVDGMIALGNTIKNAVLAPLRVVLEGASYLPGIGDNAAAALKAVNTTFADIKPPEVMQNAFDFMVTGLRDARSELHAMLMEELPSEVMAKKLDAVMDAADARAQEIAAKAQAAAGLPGFAANDPRGGVQTDNPETAAAQETEDKLTEIKAKGIADRLALEDESRNVMVEGYTALQDVMGGYFQGMNEERASYAQAAMNIGGTMLDEEKRNAVSSIWANTYDAAMGAYKALASIPYVGPVLGAGAFGVVTAAGTAAAGKVAGLYDNGGNIPAGKFGIVGEYGPELVRGPANVTSRKDTAAMAREAMNGGSGRTVTVNQTIQVSGRPDNRTASQIARESDRKQQRVQRRLGGRR